MLMFFKVVDSLTSGYRVDWLDPFGYLHDRMHQLLYWALFSSLLFWI